MLLVSHDRAFLDNIVTSTLAFEGDGRVVEYVGGWDDYLAPAEEQLQRRRQQTGGRHAPAATSSSERATARPKRHGPKKLSFKEQREFESLPAQIEALEEEQRRLKRGIGIGGLLQGGRRSHQRCWRASSALAGGARSGAGAWLELEERAGARGS